MKETQLLEIFLYAALFLGIASLLIPSLKSFKIPSILGYLVAGIVLGPQGLGQFSGTYPWLEFITLQDSKNVQLLSELGIILLLFVIGLELTPRKLWQMRSLVFGLGSAQVIVTSLVIAGIAFSWGNSIQASILLGLGLALSSTAIITEWLHEKKLFNSKAGQASFSILLLQDLAVIPILILITLFSNQVDGDFSHYLSLLILKIVIAVVLIVLFGKYFVRPAFNFSNKYGGSEVFIALSLFVIFISASIAGAAGLSMALGAFIGGLLLAETQYSHEISATIVPFKSMLIGIFFMSFGMSIDVAFIFEETLWLFLSVLGLLTLKAAIIYVLCRLWRMNRATATETALLLPQSGEFGLLVVGAALTYGLVDNYVGQFMFLTIGLTMLLTPVMTPLSRKIGKILLLADTHNSASTEKDHAKLETMKDHVVILGYGRMGKTVAETLSSQGIMNIAFDKNAERLKEAQKTNAPVYYGDAIKKSILLSANIKNAKCVIITIDSPASIRSIVDNIHDVSPSTPVIVRVHKKSQLKDISDKENLHIIPEYFSASMLIATQALEYYGYSDEEAHNILKTLEDSL